MKAATVYRANTVRYPINPAYPNAADRRYHLRKLLDGILALATGIGAITALVFLMLL